MKVHIIRTSGVEETHDVEAHHIGRLIGAEVVEAVRLRGGRVMLVDDRGYESTLGPVDARANLAVVGVEPTRARKPINEKATALYHLSGIRPYPLHQIVGDVAIVEQH